MEIKELKKKANIEQDKKLNKRYTYFEKLIIELEKKEIPSEIIDTINQDIYAVNSFSGSDKDLRKLIRKSQANIFKLIEKELKLVPKSHYMTRWMAIGMTVFGIPLGTAFGASLDNMGLLGIGLPIGLAIGLAIGAGMDEKAAKEGKQLDLDAQF